MNRQALSTHMPFVPVRPLFASVALAAVLLGCTATSDYMHPASAAQAALVAPPDRALVVFLRPSGLGKAKLFTVIDGKGHFLGDAQAGARFAVAVPPGEQTFVTWSETVAPLRANLLPGHVYYVLVDPRMGVWKARVDLLTISKRTGNWKDLKGWLDETEPYVADTAAGEANLKSEAEEVKETLSEIESAFKEMDPEEQREKTLLPEDGVPAPGAPSPAPKQSTPAPGVATGNGQPSTAAKPEA